jgi:hypothetical protein
MFDIQKAPLHSSAIIPLPPGTAQDILRDPQALAGLLPELKVSVEPDKIINAGSVIILGGIAVIKTIVLEVSEFDAATSQMNFTYHFTGGGGYIGSRIEAGETADTSVFTIGFQPGSNKGLLFLRSPLGSVGKHMLHHELSGLGKRFERVHQKRED